MAEKTEKATPKKLRDARKKGQVAKSQDLPSAFTFIASVLTVLGMTFYLFTKMSEFLILTFNQIPDTTADLSRTIPALFYEGMILIFVCSMPVLIIVSFVGVIINFLATGPVFTFEVFKPDIKKFNPIDNLKAKFKMKTLFELLKSVFKISVATYLIYLVVYKSIPVLIKTVSLPLIGSLIVFHAFLMEVVIKVGLFFIAVAILDFVYQRRNFAKEMKMEKFEVKQEYKNTEGDPQIKGKRRQIAQEIAYQDGPAATIKKAKAVVTNPKHLAVAIGYERELDQAPYILAMGSDELANRIIKIAEQYNVPVMRNIPLAHELWKCEPFQYVPEETYGALAEILRWVESLKEEY